MEQTIDAGTINNHFYDELGERWYNDDEHIIALLRAETEVKLSYVRTVLRKEGFPPPARILDIGCGAGFLSNALAKDGWRVWGVDQSPESIRVAQTHAPKGNEPEYQAGDAYNLPFPSERFEAVMLMDFLEHVEDPARALKEASRVLAPGGLIIFYTFNRTLLSRLLAIKAVEWLARDCPKNFHVWKFFIKPQELNGMLDTIGFRMSPLRGVKPRILHWPFWASILRRRIHATFQFEFTSDLKLGYLGYAKQDWAENSHGSSH